MSHKNGVKTPQIRFKGFNDGWNPEPLGNAISLDNGFAFKSRFFSRKPTNVIVVTPGSVHIGGGFQEGKGQFYDPSEVVPDKYKFHAGDIFVTMTDLTPTAQALGFPARIPDNGITYLHNQRLGKLTGFDGDEEFLFQLLSTENYHRYIATTSSGTTVKHSSPQKILSFEAHFPSLPEQTEIGAYFKSLDRMIGLHQRKHDKLVTLKQAMLQKMFPQDGATTPEIRFKGFEGDWNEHMLGDLMQVGSVKRIHQSDWTKRGIRFLRARDIVSAFKNEDPADLLYISQEKYEDYSRQSGKVERGDLLVTGVGTIGVPYLISNDEPVYFKDGNIIWFKNAGAINGDFFYYAFASDRVQSHINESAGIGTVGTYTIDSGKKTPFIYPNPDEQQMVGSYFRKLDELISKHATQLEKLKNIKSACLEKMFV